MEEPGSFNNRNRACPQTQPQSQKQKRVKATQQNQTEN